MVQASYEANHSKLVEGYGLFIISLSGFLSSLPLPRVVDPVAENNFLVSFSI